MCENIKIPAIKGLVFTEKGYLAPDSDFEVCTDTNQITAILTKPIFIENSGNTMTDGIDKTIIDVKSTIAMGKAAFIEQPITINNVKYNFVQWKGVGLNPANQISSENVLANGGQIIFPLGRGSIMPLFVLDIKGKNFVRFMGGAYYQDLLLESENSKIMEQHGLRMPKIISTIKFSKKFCDENNLPIPKNDDPNYHDGPSLLEFIESDKDIIEPKLYKKMMTSSETSDYESAILGQNVRAFKNVWRVSEIEEILKETDETKRVGNISAILRTSMEIFAKEFNEEIDENQFVEKFAKLLGKQVAILLTNNLIHGAMDNHKQDITLAAEICDFDGTYQLTEEYFTDDNNKPKWVTDETALIEWKQQKQQQLYRQILLVGSHIKPIIDVARQIGNPQDEERIIDIFVTEILTDLSFELIQLLQNFINNSDKFQNIADIAGDDQMTQSNFDSYQNFFDIIVNKIQNYQTRF